MADRPRSTGGETTPIEFAQTPPPPPTYEPSHVMQSLIELQRSVATSTTKLERLISDVEKLDSHVDGMRQKIVRAEGVAICGFVLVGLFAGFVWWLIGGQITSLRDQLMAIHATAPQNPAAPASPPVSNP